MPEWMFDRLLDLSASISGALLVLWFSRPWLKRRGGAALLYASWLSVLLVPLVATAPAPRMPAPVAQVRRRVRTT